MRGVRWGRSPSPDDSPRFKTLGQKERTETRWAKGVSSKRNRVLCGGGFGTQAATADPVLFPAAARSRNHIGHNHWDHQLKLAVAWNRVDIARSEIFTDERRWKVRLLGLLGGAAGWALEGGPGHPAPASVEGFPGKSPPPSPEDNGCPRPQGAGARVPGGGDRVLSPHHSLPQPSELHPVMTAALISNKPEFVKLFLEHGLQLKDLLTGDTLLYLYENLDAACLFHAKLQKRLAEEPGAAALRLDLVAQALRELLGDFSQLLYPRPRPGDRTHLPLPGPHRKFNVRAGALALSFPKQRSWCFY